MAHPTLEKLKEDHRKAFQLIDEYILRIDDADKKLEILRKLFRLLYTHMESEEEYLYAAIAHVSDEGMHIAEDSKFEHQTLKDLMEDINNINPIQEEHSQKFILLMENLRTHIRKEENKVFTFAHENLYSELDQIGLFIEEMRHWTYV